MKNTRKILFSAALLSSGLIYIMADDLGIGDLGCYGHLKFMQHYSGSTVSAPPRCALITGKHMGHAAIRGNAKVAGSDGLLYETSNYRADIFKTIIRMWQMGKGPG